jgi:hypothetical protein
MELSPSWEAASCSVTQECPNILWYPTVFIRAPHCPLPWATSIQPIPPNRIPPRSILMLSFHLLLSFFQIPHQNSLCLPLLHIRATCPIHIIFWLDRSNYIWRSLHVMKLLVIEFSPISYYFIPLRPSCFPQHPFLKYLQTVFFPKCRIPCFTSIWKLQSK